ncbi:glycosyltransferase family 92 protein RCOM_0530710-like [Impatiens glandulifera]|uniref:glycosyltransferase family 92 protein RCOM_0530710-like n=1 Tax=Impatiens glandulifera TaxID=253017 RepID=UPI001FB13F82|nr:glycosyltransferase family 92 protein RCOM_0530710-like [Impatiens glandulifera]
MESDQRRRRKRMGRSLSVSSSSSSSSYLSVRSLILCLSFLIFLYLLSTQIPVARSAFRPVLKASSFPLLSTTSSSSSSIPLQHISSSSSSSTIHPQFQIQDRVLFPDHVLLIIAYVGNNHPDLDDLECIYYYYKDLVVSGHEIETKPVISSDVYEQNQYIVRCPLPPTNFSSIVNLNKRGGRIYDRSLPRTSLKLHSWETLAYAAALDGNTAVVLVKGLNLRSDRQSDPRQFTCHFGVKEKETSILTTRAISAAQEVIRCSLPRSIQMNPNKAEGIRVTIGTKVRARLHSKTENRVLVPSVAKILNPKVVMEKKKSNKYELCVCTMAWNQASALREWIVYHSWLGVERWFIYDNNSNDGTKDVIEELANYNVSRHVWPWIKTQEAGFSHCAIRARTECNWVGFFDVDEFFYFPTNEDGYRNMGQDSLRNLVSNFSTTNVAEIRTSCHSFGPSGLNSAPSKGVTVGYTCRLQSPERHKSIVRPEALDATLLNVIHHFRLRNGFESVNLPQSRALINHYKYQVWDSFKAKFFRRVATYVADWQENQNEGSKDRAPGLGTEAIEPPNWSLQFCEVWDTGLRDFILSNMADSFSGLLPWEESNLLL